MKIPAKTYPFTLAIIILLALFPSCINNDKLPSSNTQYYTVPKNEDIQFKLLHTNSIDSLNSNFTKAIIDTTGWTKTPSDESKLKQANQLLVKFSIDISKYKTPAMMISGRLVSLSIYRDTTILFSRLPLSTRKCRAKTITKVIPLEGNSTSTIYLAFYYNSIYCLPNLNVFRIGELSHITDHTILLDSADLSVILDSTMGYIFGTIGLIAFIAAFFYKQKSRYMLLYFALFGVTSGLSSIIDLFSVYLNMSSYNLLFAEVTLSTMAPVGFIGFIRYALFPRRSRFLYGTFLFSLAWCVSFPFLSMPFSLNLVYWLGLSINIILVSIALTRERVYARRDLLFPFWGFIILIINLIINILNTVKIISWDASSDFGIMIMMFSLIVYTTKTIVHSREQVQHYELELAQTKNQLLSLEYQNIQSQFNALKGQLDPHFLFNSLNTLASLINVDQSRATRFVEEFSMLYRRLLDVKNEMLVPLKDELRFLNSYTYLQKIRFGENLHFKLEIIEADLGKLVPPLSLQLLVENALKHNEISEDFPLHITIKSDGKYLSIINPLHPKLNTTLRKGIGLENLKNRYLQISNRIPIFARTDKEYVVMLPLIEEE